MTTTLRSITIENWIECIKLKVRQGQQDFVATNVYSIAESKVDPSMVPKAIYNEEVMVGFTMYGRDPEDGKYWIVRLMIDEQYQGNGYGKQAILQVINLLKQNDNCTDITVSHLPLNKHADTFYRSLGFKDNGEVIDGEVVKRLFL
ncbi:GNAT family N-acetyltransferase [Chloroflexota bacterium]